MTSVLSETHCSTKEQTPKIARFVTKRDGSTEKFIPDKINHAVEKACKSLENVYSSEIIIDAHIKLYDGVTTKEIDDALIISARSKIEKEPNYSFAAARILLSTIYKEAFGEDPKENIKTQYDFYFVKNLKHLIEEGTLNAKLLSFDLRKMSAAIKPERDMLFKYLGLQTVYDRYLQHIRKRRVESPQAFFMRVAMGLAINEEHREEYAIKFYNALSTFRALNSTPTLFNSGSTHSQLSSCFLNTFDDSIDGIFDGLWQEARKSKYAGGLGYDLTSLRSRGSFIKGTNGESHGSVFFWKLFNDMLVAVDQGGKRKGAGCGYLETWHADFEDFIMLRKNTGDERVRTHDMNTANWIPDLFMKQVINEGPWFLFSPNETPELHETFGAEFEEYYWKYVKKGESGALNVFIKVDAKEIWKKMLRILFETGHPWITFKDPCNMRYANQHEGVVHSSNLCTEIVEHTHASKYESGVKTKIGETAVCNLASINLKEHVANGTIQWDLMSDTIHTVVRMLDNVIDLNFYPTQEASSSNFKHRFIGIGSMGWQDLYYMLGVFIDSEEAINLADDLYQFISRESIMSSSKLAKERGKYMTYDGSLWSQNIFPIDSYRELAKYRNDDFIFVGSSKEEDQWTEVRDHVKKYGMRNALTSAIAPTATISYIAGCSQSTEPNFSVLFVYSTLSGEFTMINEYFVNDMKDLGLWMENTIELVKSVDGDLSLLPDAYIPINIKKKYRTAFNINQFKLIEAGAARQKWLDQSASLNLYNNKTSLKFLHELYIHAWKMGLKTTYYLRNLSASKIEKSTIDQEKLKENLSNNIVNGIECLGCQ